MRSTLRRICHVLATVSLSFSLAGGASANALVSWPQLGLDAGHSGYNPTEKTLTTTNVAKLHVLWSVGTGGAAGGLVYDRGFAYGYSGDGNLYAVDAKTGKVKWRSSIGVGGLPNTPVPAVSNGTIVAECTNGQGGSNARSGLCGLDEGTGRVRWSDLCASTYCGVEAAPSIVGSLAYYEVSDNGGTNYFNAVNVASGNVVWSVTTGNHCAGNATGTPVPAANGFVYLTLACQGPSSNQTEICAFGAQNGGEVWCTAALGDASQGVVSGDGTIVAGVGNCFGTCNDTIQAFDAKTGASKWVVDTGTENNFAATPAIANGVVYESIYPSGVQALNVATGKPIFAQSANSVGGGISLANGVAYVECSSSACALSAKSGKLLWAAQTGAAGATTPIVVDGVVYGACSGSSFCAWSLPKSRYAS